MINLKSLLSEDLRKISIQMATDEKMFGPVYHGTKQENIPHINKDGFKVIKGLYGSSGMANGYVSQPYYEGIPAPIHHLGFGVYFTTVKSIAKKFAGDTTKGMQTFFLDVPKIEEINFAAPKNMMKWWIKHGYDPELAKQGEGGRTQATVKLTDTLKSEFDAVWFKGKGLHRLLDGEQICVYDPSNIYVFDKSLIKPGEIGSKVVTKVDIDPYNRGTNIIPKGTNGIIYKKTIPTEQQTWAKESNFVYTIKLKVGGYLYNITDDKIELK